MVNSLTLNFEFFTFKAMNFTHGNQFGAEPPYDMMGGLSTDFPPPAGNSIPGNTAYVRYISASASIAPIVGWAHTWHSSVSPAYRVMWVPVFADLVPAVASLISVQVKWSAIVAARYRAENVHPIFNGTYVRSPAQFNLGMFSPGFPATGWVVTGTLPGNKGTAANTTTFLAQYDGVYDFGGVSGESVNQVGVTGIATLAADLDFVAADGGWSAKGLTVTQSNLGAYPLHPPSFLTAIKGVAGQGLTWHIRPALSINSVARVYGGNLAASTISPYVIHQDIYWAQGNFEIRFNYT